MSRTVPATVFAAFEKTRHYQQALADARRELDRRRADAIPESDPNHPTHGLHLFGLPAADLMAMQYPERKK